MSVPQLEQLDSLDHRDEFRSRAILQAAITEAFALLNAGARQEAIAQIKQYADLAARSNAGCYIFGLIYFNVGDLRHALTWFDRALALQPEFPKRSPPAPSFFSGLVSHTTLWNRSKKS